MECKHEHIKSVNCVLSCIDCGEILPEGFQTAQKQGKNELETEKPVKSQAKKRAAKTAGKGA